MKIFFYYKKILGALYFFGFILHLLDLFDLRLQFSLMDSIWKKWVIYLTVADLFAGLGLLASYRWGEWFFLLVAGSQLYAYTAHTFIFGSQIELIIFHFSTVSTYFYLFYLERKKITEHASTLYSR